jgi:ubiquinone/menaquinone biosynthesis C-methylase UbiE
MAEKDKSFPLSSIPHADKIVDAQYGIEGAPSANLNARWKVYERAVAYVDPLRKMYDMAMEHGLKRDGTIIDAGCNDARDLIALGSESYGHKGIMYGVDPYIDPMSRELSVYNANTKDRPPIIPVVSGIEDAEFNDDSIDGVFSKFMLYHVQDQGAVLAKFQRILVPGGIAVVATSGQNNKPRHREFEGMIAEYLGVKPPPHFNQRFTAQIAEMILPKYFDVKEMFPGPLDLQYSYASYGWDNYSEYIDSILSMEGSFSPVSGHTEFMRAVENAVVPKIQAAIRLNGSFVETIDRRFYVCIKSPDLTD